MNNNARMFLLGPIRRTTLPGVGPTRVKVPAPDDDDADTGIYEIGPREPLPFDCDVEGEKRGV